MTPRRVAVIASGHLLTTVYLVADRDDRNLAVLIALLSGDRSFSIVVSSFNEQVAPHLRAAHMNILVLNPARIAAPAFVAAGASSKVVGIVTILGATFFIWMIFSLTVDRIIKRRVQLALGRRRYDRDGHVVLCGLGRLGHFVAEELLQRGEQLIIVERSKKK